MSKSTGPYSITLGDELELTPPDAGVAWQYVVLSNLSGMAAQVQGAPWLQAWTAQVYDISATDTLYVTPSLIGASGAASTGQLTADWYRSGESLPGVYPAPLVSQAIAAAISGSVNIGGGTLTGITDVIYAGNSETQQTVDSSQLTLNPATAGLHTLKQGGTLGAYMRIGILSLNNWGTQAITFQLENGAGVICFEVEMAAGASDAWPINHNLFNSVNAGLGYGGIFIYLTLGAGSSPACDIALTHNVNMTVHT